MSYEGLRRQVEGTAAWLNARDIGRGDRVQIVLPNGPESAVAFLGVSLAATAAPLNPNFRAAEFEFYLSDLKARALIVQRGFAPEARTAAQSAGVPIIELSPLADAGRFTLNGSALDESVAAAYSETDDIALVLHTSGTTSRPKIVPLSHRNLCASADHIAATLQLTAADRCLNVMPLFHIHGLVAAVLASLRAGGSVVCTPGIEGAPFFDWLDEFRPTWYTAVPTIHQEVLRQAAQFAAGTAGHNIRFIRSSSASLPPRVMEDLESMFGVPVIEAYGMTEAAHQMASNPLPPRQRRPGTVGPAAGPEIAIVDEQWSLVPCGTAGEVVIRGPNVTAGYENNPAANAAAFRNGWCRTGDEGVLDGEGYLTLTGRLKEMINRGGEKIAPREIEELLLKYSGVRQAVAFALHHPALGEEVAAAVVPVEGVELDEAALREFAWQHLPGFKVPTRVLILQDIPKGPTGKLQRIGLAERLAEQLTIAYEQPAEGLEQMIASAFEQVLQRQNVGRNDNFFALGGDSIRAMQVVVRLSATLGFDVPPTILFRRPTPAVLGIELAGPQQEQAIASLAQALLDLPPGEAEQLLGQVRRT